MKLALVVALLVGVAIADPRGSKGIRGHSIRKLQMDKGEKDDKADKGVTEVAGVAKEDDKEEVDAEESEGSIVETHACIADPQEAIDFMNGAGSAAMGDQSCFADPVNGCPGGCCRLGNWFVCDTENSHPSLPCICNSETAPVIDVDISGSDSSPMGNMTMSGNTTMVSATAPSTAPLTPEEFAALYPEVLSAIEAQESAPLPGVDVDGEEEVDTDKRVRIALAC
jgi:hypothetical protein